jgi:hypothetical protein
MKKSYLPAGVIGALALGLPAQADTVIFNYGRQAGNQWGYDVGMDFTVNSAVTVTALGSFDANIAGLTDPVTTAQINTSLEQGITSGVAPVIQVGIYNVNTGLEVSPTVSFTYNSPNLASYYAIAGSIFQNITPINLPPGTYSIVAAGYDYLLAFGNITAVLPPTTPTFSTLLGALSLSGDARVNGTGFGTPPLAFPTSYTTPESNPDFLAGTFIATNGIAGVPDGAATLGLLAGALVTLGAVRRGMAARVLGGEGELKE